MTVDARKILEEYVSAGKLMQVSSVSDTGFPAVCHVWYLAQFRPDALYFISRRDREHSANIRRNERVAGGIVTIPLTGLGQKVTGVTFTGRARELGADARDQAERFTARWPNARIATAGGDDGSARLYEIRVDEWILFDETSFPESPRRDLAGER